jgi:hypothetical protein
MARNESSMSESLSPTLLDKFRGLDLQARLRASHVIGGEKEILLRLLDDVDSELGGYDTRIAGMQSALLVVQNERTELQKLANCARGLLAPVRRMPSELLSEVFALCGLEVKIERTVKTPALDLGCVCTRWNEVISGSPNLWSTVSLVIGRDLDAEKQTRLVLRALKKSAPLPLTLEVADAEDNPYILPEQNETHPSINALIQECFRWRHLTVKLTVPTTNAFFASVVGKLSMLVSLTFANQGKPDRVSLENDLDIFKDVPTLRTVTLPTSVDRTSYFLPLETLDTFEMGGFSTEVISVILSRARNLRILKINHCPLQGVVMVPGQSVVNSESLRTLNIEFIYCSTYSAVSHLFSCVSLPRLQALSLTSPHSSHCGHPHGDTWVPSLVGMLNRSHCSIQTLVIAGVRITQDSLVSIFRNVSSLRDLTLHERPASNVASAPIDDKLLTLLTLSSASSGSDVYSQVHTTLLPNLERIELRAGGLSFSDKTFVDMISSRWRGSPSSVVAGDSLGESGKSIRSVNLRVLSRALLLSHYLPLKMLEQKELFTSISGKDGILI